MVKRGSKKKIFFIAAIVIVLAVAVYFTLFHYYRCDDMGCFKGHQEKCAKTKFLNDAQDVAWKYTINGKEDGKCSIDVEILLVKEGELANRKLEGASMECLLPLGSIAPPDADIAQCHGILKERMQDLIIQKLHSYILENVGEINEGLGYSGIESMVNGTA